MEVCKILCREEIQAVIRRYRKTAKDNEYLNFIVFRLATCCGLRSKEIRLLDCGDLILVGSAPCIRIRKEATKGPKPRARTIPLHWDSGTLKDLQAWMAYRKEMGACKNDPFVCSTKADSRGNRIKQRQQLARKFKSVLANVLPAERVEVLHLHCGRHTFCSHSLHYGRSLPEVRDAAGHRDISTTSIYLHTIDSGEVPDLFPESDDDA